MNRHILRYLAAAAAAALLLAACGSDGGGGADTAVGQALADELMSDGDSPLAGEEEARCMAGDIVDNVGEDRLAELGVTAETVSAIEDIDFTDEETDTVLDALFDCVDVQRVMAEEMASDFGDEAAGCIAENLDESLLREAMAVGFGGDIDAEPSNDFLQGMLDVMAECDVPLGG